MKSTTLSLARSQAVPRNTLPAGVGKHAKRVDAALPGKHTRLLYDHLSWKEASVLAQLRTGMARLNGYLYRINAADTDQCACGQAKEAVEHFLFRCRKWTAHRTELLQFTNTHRGNLSFYLGGKSPSDDQKCNTIRHSHRPPRGHLTPPTNINRPVLSNLTHQPPRATHGGRASTAEDRMLNTWKSAFKPVY